MRPRSQFRWWNWARRFQHSTALDADKGLALINRLMDARPKRKNVQAERTDTLEVRTSQDVVRVRQAVRNRAVELGFSVVDQTKFVTAASEIARNTIDHGGGGRVRIETLREVGKRGLRLIFEDQGPGIPDIELALRDGYSTGGGMGLGLPGSKRLSSEFHVESTVGKGTKITLIRWKLLSKGAAR
jgi:serine/threonine-protein kinase RsbT